MLRTRLSLQRGAASRRLGSSQRRSAAHSWERSGVLSFGPATVRQQTSLEAASRQPKPASHLCRIKPPERSHPARNDPCRTVEPWASSRGKEGGDLELFDRTNEQGLRRAKSGRNGRGGYARVQGSSVASDI